MRAYGFQIGALQALRSGVRYDDRDFTFGLQVLRVIGSACGLTLESMPDEGNLFDVDALFVSILSTDMYWDLPKWLRKRDVVTPASARSEAYPLVVGGGQAFYNPEPVADIFDLIFIGDADATLCQFVSLFHKQRQRLSRLAFLDACRAIPGVYVPALDDGTRMIQAQISQDIGASLQKPLIRQPRGVRRVEIARGCPSKCPFCVLGWRSAYRENRAQAVLAALETQPRESRYVHLQASDAENHQEIEALRAGIDALGLRDKSWTGRLDKILDNPESTLQKGKYYAFGIEAPSARMRAVYGKPYDNDFILDALRSLYARGATGVGFHVILGLPGEMEEDIAEFRDLVQRIAAVRAVRDRHLTLHWHWAYFQPASHTPMQWAAPGMTKRMHEVAEEEWHIDDDAAIYAKIGRWLRSLSRHMTACISGRGDRRTWWLMLDLEKRLRKVKLTDPETPLMIREVVAAYGYDPAYFFGELAHTKPLPWHFVRARFDMESLWSVWQTMQRRLAL